MNTLLYVYAYAMTNRCGFRFRGTYMKTLITVGVCFMLLVLGTALVCTGQDSGSQRVRCCVRGKCMAATKMSCDKFRGITVKDCTECR
ncbi:MAG TPA: hypothetical protein VK463_20005 [Desulfomonilaceae bacterium]|nr:hypothetical protein [Desulfomonilaceae bacterium]